MKDITKYVPAQYRRPGIKYCLTDQADEQVRMVAEQMEVDDVGELYSAVAVSASSFFTSTYFTKNSWFRDRPHHPFVAARLAQGDREEALRLVLSTKDGHLLAESEIVLPDEYYGERVIEESKVEYTGIET